VTQIIDRASRAPHAVLEASAGTGKTYTIERLVLDLIVTRGVPLDQILVLTFTERATNELRARIRGLIERRLLAPPDGGAATCGAGASARAALEAAYLQFEVLSIHTIHAFMQRVLTQDAFHARRLLDQEVSDGRTLFHMAFLASVRRRLAIDPVLAGYLRVWFAGAGGSMERLEALLRDCARLSVAGASLYPPCDPDALADRVAATDLPCPRPGDAPTASPPEAGSDGDLDEARARAIIDAELSAAAGGGAGARASTRRAVAGQLAALAVRIREARSAGSPAPVLAYLDSRARSGEGSRLAFLAARLPSVVPASAPEGLAASLRDLVMDLAAAHASLRGALVAACLPAVAGELERLKRRTGRYVVDVMIRLGWKASEDDPSGPLVRSLRARYRHVLIDEFQDTDRLQWKIFSHVFFRSPAGHRLVLIGDPKQAIYGFRGADVAAYLEARSEVQSHAGVEPLRLDENFRSTERMVAAVNLLFDDGATRPAFQGGIRYGAGVRCGNRALAARWASGGEVVPVQVLRLVADGPVTKQRMESVLARAIAREIRALIADPRRGVTVTGGLDGDAEPRSVRARDVFLLTYTNHDGEVAARHLRDEGVPHAFYKQPGLFATEEARDILHVLRAIEEPGSERRCARAWTTPFFAVPLPALPRTRGLVPDHPLMDLLHRWRELAVRRSWVTLFSRMVEQSGLALRELYLKESERELTNYLHLFEILTEEAHRTHPELGGVIAHLGGLIGGTRRLPGQEEDLKRLESDRDAVQIMTIHRSKGLEADVVFVFGGLPGGRIDRLPRLLHDASGRQVIAVDRVADVEALARREHDEENQRLAYVALTRARIRTAVPSVPPGAASSARSMDTAPLARVFSRLEDLLAAAGGPDPALFDVVSVAASAQGPDMPPQATPPQATPPQATPPQAAPSGSPPEPSSPLPPLPPLPPPPSAEAFDDLRRRAAPIAVTSYSRLARRVAGAGPGDPGGRAGASGAGAVQREDFRGDLPGRAARARERSARERSERPSGTDQQLPRSDPAPTATPPAAGSAGRLPGGIATGLFLHAVLEQVPLASLAARPALQEWAARPDVKPLFERMLDRYGLPRPALPESQRLVHTALSATIDLAGRTVHGLGLCPRVRREVEFVYPIPEPGHPPPGCAPPDGFGIERGYVKGFIDLVFELDGRVYLADWKSDALVDFGAASVAERVENHYRIQANLYTLAVVKMLGIRDERAYEARFGGLVYVFLRGLAGDPDPGRGIFHERPTYRDVIDAEAALRSGEWLH
jgi:exodeoxyribonuclease V beta subunit